MKQLSKAQTYSILLILPNTFSEKNVYKRPVPRVWDAGHYVTAVQNAVQQGSQANPTTAQPAAMLPLCMFR